MKIVAHTMEYRGETLCSKLKTRNYSADDFAEYKQIYEECFFDMRTALERFPVNCCRSAGELLQKSSMIFILEVENQIAGSIAIYGNEIDDLIVSKKFRRQGYGKALLQFAVALMQKNNVSPIILHAADWNQNAIKMYLNNGFKIVKTETVRQG